MSKVSLFHKAPGLKAAAPHPAGAPAPGEYGLQIDENGSATFNGVNAAHELVDISAIATLTATSSDPSILAVGPVAGMTVPYSAAGVGKATVTLVATANDGSFTFTVTDPCDVDKNAVRGAQITHGTPTIKP